MGVAGDAGPWSGPAAAGRRAGRAARARAAVLDHPRAPAAVLLLATVLVGGLAALLGRQLVTVALDEALFKASAAHYVYDGLPGALFDDVTARATARLYPLWLSPFVALLPGDAAVAAARAANGLLFASASIPTYLLARRLLASPWAAVAAAVGAVAVPWIAISAVLYAESLAYPLFVWALLAITVALRRPAWWRDALAVAALALLLATRTQFIALVPAYLVLVAARVGRDARTQGLGPGDLSRLAAAAVRRFPVSIALAAAGVAAIAALAAGGELSNTFRRVFGTYSEIQTRGGLPQSVGLAALHEVVALGLGMGVVPVVLAAAWAARVLEGGRGRFARDVLAGAAVLFGLLFAVTLAAQSGYLGDRSEERYFLYVVPAVWIAAVAAVEARAVAPRAVLVGGGAFAALCACVPLVTSPSAQWAFLAPSAFSVRSATERAQAALERATGLTPVVSGLDLVALVALAVVVVAAVVWRRAPRLRAGLLALALALQLAVAGYAFASIRGDVPGVPGQVADVPAGELGWVDRAVPGEGPVAWIAGVRQQAPGFVEDLQRSTLFHNDEIRTVASAARAGAMPKAPSFGALPDQPFDVGPDGRVAPAPAPAYAVVGPDSPFVQLAGPVVVDREVLALQRLERPVRATWLATGLTDAGLPAGDAPVRLRVPSAPARVTLRLTGAHDGPSALRVRLGGRRLDVAFAGRQERAVTVDVCPGRGQRGALAVRRGAPVGSGAPSAAAVLTAVEVAPGAACPR